jgi:hypothetical protein
MLDTENYDDFNAAMSFGVAGFCTLILFSIMLYTIIFYNEINHGLYVISAILLFLLSFGFGGLALSYYRNLLYIPSNELAKLNGLKRQAAMDYIAANPDKPLSYGTLRLVIKRAIYDKEKERSIIAKEKRQLILCALREDQENQLKNGEV